MLEIQTRSPGERSCPLCSSHLLSLSSPMPGAIEKVLVKVGQSVSPGDVLLTVSAMKMEVKVTAPHEGIVKGLCVDVGTRVVEGALLVRLG
jgi:biotin carboxyl carrier protein